MYYEMHMRHTSKTWLKCLLCRQAGRAFYLIVCLWNVDAVSCTHEDNYALLDTLSSMVFVVMDKSICVTCERS